MQHDVVLSVVEDNEGIDGQEQPPKPRIVQSLFLDTEKVVQTAAPAFSAKAYLCDQLNVEISPTPTYYQGSVVRVCVSPETDDQVDNLFMRSIDRAEFASGDGMGAFQNAITDGVPTLNGLTSYSADDCRGSVICHFETILFAEFFLTPGPVSCSGYVTMQFGVGVRHWKRGLQEDNVAAEMVPFYLEDLSVAAPTDLPTPAPSKAPSPSPSTTPSLVPSALPTSAPSSIPTAAPSVLPSDTPSTTPTGGGVSLSTFWSTAVLGAGVVWLVLYN